MVERAELIAMVRGLQNGDPDASSKLFSTFQSDIYYFILKTVNNDRELAEDLTQDTFVEILETIDKLQEPAAFVTWSKQIAYHKCTAYFRKRKELLVDEDEDGYSVFDTIEEEDIDFIPDAALDQQDLKQTIINMINDLPEEQKSAILLRYFNEISVKEIAEIQGVTEGTVKSRLNYGRKAIKQSVEEYEKKNDVKLHCAGVLPLLLWLFKDYRIKKDLHISSNTALQEFIIDEETMVAAAVTTGTTATVAKAVVVGRKSLTTKVIAGIAVAAIAFGGVSMSIAATQSPEESEQDIVATFETDASELLDIEEISTECWKEEAAEETVESSAEDATEEVEEALSETLVSLPEDGKDEIGAKKDTDSGPEAPSEEMTQIPTETPDELPIETPTEAPSAAPTEVPEESVACEHNWYYTIVVPDQLEQATCNKCGATEMIYQAENNDSCNHDWFYYTNENEEIIYEQRECRSCHQVEILSTTLKNQHSE